MSRTTDWVIEELNGIKEGKSTYKEYREDEKTLIKYLLEKGCTNVRKTKIGISFDLDNDISISNDELFKLNFELNKIVYGTMYVEWLLP